MRQANSFHTKRRTYPKRYSVTRRMRKTETVSCWMKILCGCVAVFVLGILFVRVSSGKGIRFASFRQKNTERPEEQLMLSVFHENALLEMGLEDYLVCVVAAEMPADYHSEALKAQAVAARTYTLRKMEKSGCNRAEGADVCTDSGHCQAYADEARLKKRWGANYEKNLEKIRDAVYATAGEILTYQDQAIDAMYHASAGGHTENSEDVYKNEIPYLRGVESPDADGYEKTISYSREEFAERISRKLGVTITPERLESELEILSRFDSGRIKKIRVGTKTFSGNKFRGAAGLPSALFTYVLTADNITFSTRGYGHGVGMSQSGANYYANEGWDYREILLHYYTGVTLENN